MNLGVSFYLGLGYVLPFVCLVGYIKRYAAGETGPRLTTAESDAGPVEARVFMEPKGWSGG